MKLDATIGARAATRRVWDSIVIGAGPAGAFAAREIAQSGGRVLLLDRQRFPRSKVCGGCLNQRTLSFLRASGLGSLPARAGGVPIERFALWTGSAPLEISIPPGIAVSRTALDAALVAAAIESGAEFLPGCRAVLGEAGPEHRSIGLPDQNERLEARLVIAADGLGGSFLASRAANRPRIARGSRLGAGAVFPDTEAAVRPGAIHMAVSRAGYVGVVKLENGLLDVASALDRQTVSRRGVAGAIQEILDGSGLPPVDLSAAVWRGTPQLTRRARTVALDRVLLVGDAAGYVEPFTGEGISWALETARDASRLWRRSVEPRQPDLERQWCRLYRRQVGRRQRWCKLVALALRRPALVRWGARLVARRPGLAAPLLTHLNAMPALPAAPARAEGGTDWVS